MGVEDLGAASGCLLNGCKQDDVAGPEAFTVLAIMFVEVRKGPSTDNPQNQRFE
jgi:hypothetical protein